MDIKNLWDNQNRNALTGYNFMLRVEALYDIPCKSIRGFTRENEYEVIQEGGLNDYVHMRRKPISKPFTFQVERYCGVNAYFDPLPNGAQLILPVLLLVSRYAGDFTKIKRVYVFTGCTVMSKEYGTLDAEKSSLLTETATISYREMICFDIPVDIEKDKWKFEGRKAEGNGKLSAVSAASGKAAGIQNRSREEGEKAALERKWSFNGKDEMGNGKVNRLTRPSVDEKQTGGQRKWPPVRSAKDINQFLSKS